jgi:hypothetical protein
MNPSLSGAQDRLVEESAILRFQYQAAGAVFGELADLFLFRDADGFAGNIRATNVHRIENVAKSITSESQNTYLFKSDPKVTGTTAQDCFISCIKASSKS